MTDYPSFGGHDLRPVDYGQARVAVLPVPYEGTVSYGGGASEGPRALLEASDQMEKYDEELDWSIDEAGIVTLPPVDLDKLDPAGAMTRIQEAAAGPLGDGKVLAGVGGEHSITVGLCQALLEARGGEPFSVLQIDAHADLRSEYEGERYSHACVMARLHEMGLPFVQVGIRSLSAEERSFLRETRLERNVFWALNIHKAMDSSWMNEVVNGLPGDVYVTFDIDGLDPSIVPATGTPEPGGLGWYDALRLLGRVARRRNIISMDLTELAPIPGQHAPNFLAARLLYKMIGYATVRQVRGE